MVETRKFWNKKPKRKKGWWSLRLVHGTCAHRKKGAIETALKKEEEKPMKNAVNRKHRQFIIVWKISPVLYAFSFTEYYFFIFNLND